jgi:hypothetical protein
MLPPLSFQILKEETAEAAAEAAAELALPVGRRQYLPQQPSPNLSRAQSRSLWK